MVEQNMRSTLMIALIALLAGPAGVSAQTPSGNDAKVRTSFGNYTNAQVEACRRKVDAFNQSQPVTLKRYEKTRLVRECLEGSGRR
jgi:hypothetical protein